LENEVAQTSHLDLFQHPAPPLVQFFGVVDTNKLVLADNPEVGLDETTRNCSAIFFNLIKFVAMHGLMKSLIEVFDKHPGEELSDSGLCNEKERQSKMATIYCSQSMGY
jgi:hypothetical protein